jgi:Glycosyltransferase family 10 (fucosyltransferase) C-term/Fucosyltransferase, N-terminal
MTIAAARPPLILFYNRAFAGFGDPTKVDCGGSCELTADPGRLAEVKAIVFHIPTLRGIPLPPKHPLQQWVAWSMESAVNYPELVDPTFMRQFEITMTYRRDATIWWPYFGPEIAAAILAPPHPKTESSPVVHFRSSAIDRCGRTAYTAALMRRVKVDSYGGVLHTRDLPEPDKGWETLLATTARYKFALVLENSIAEDYVSEKFFYALMSGSVPVYRGAPNISVFAPADRCFINAADFAGPVELAAYLNWLNEHDEVYQEYLAWKHKGLSRSFQTLVASVHVPALCRLCEHLRRTFDPI